MAGRKARGGRRGSSGNLRWAICRTEFFEGRERRRRSALERKRADIGSVSPAKFLPAFQKARSKLLRSRFGPSIYDLDWKKFTVLDFARRELERSFMLA